MSLKDCRSCLKRSVFVAPGASLFVREVYPKSNGERSELPGIKPPRNPLPPPTNRGVEAANAAPSIEAQAWRLPLKAGGPERKEVVGARISTRWAASRTQVPRFSLPAVGPSKMRAKRSFSPMG